MTNASDQPSQSEEKRYTLITVSGDRWQPNMPRIFDTEHSAEMGIAFNKFAGDQICNALNAPADNGLITDINNFYEERESVSYTPQKLLKFKDTILMDSLLQRCLAALGGESD